MAWILMGGVVDMGVFGVWTGSTMVVIRHIVAAAPTVIPVFMIFDQIRVGGFVVEPMLSGMAWVLLVHRGYSL
jgi:hypothetical protein